MDYAFINTSAESVTFRTLNHSSSSSSSSFSSAEDEASLDSESQLASEHDKGTLTPLTIFDELLIDPLLHPSDPVPKPRVEDHQSSTISKPQSAY